MSALKACFQIAECSLSSAKIMQMSALKACFQIAECSLSSAKISRKLETTKGFCAFRHVLIEKYHELVVLGHELVEISLLKLADSA